MLGDFDHPSNAGLSFSRAQWIGLVVAGDISAAISFLANSIVLIIHAFMLKYRPVVVARLSLRMIVLSCLFNMFYCVGQLVADVVQSINYGCRVLIYVLIISDTMACMCLAMVGFNLVMIFVLKVSRSIKLEIVYYVIIVACGVLVAVVPIAVNRRVRPNPIASCWYHYYFDGRLHALFNWWWYYSWLMFSSVFAACCAVISLAFVLQKQGNLAGTLDMFTLRDKDGYSKIQRLKRYSINNTDVFKKIAKRCILYPLVPLISKSWGIGIVIAASSNAYIPYPVFVIDRVFSCLLGLMVSCIYYTDPALLAVFNEGIENLKEKYVYDYYSVRYQPGVDPTTESKSQYPQRIRIVEQSNNNNFSSPLGISTSFNRPMIYHQEDVSSPNVYNMTGNSGPDTTDSMVGPYDTTSNDIRMSDLRRPSVSFKTGAPAVEVRKTLGASFSKEQARTSQKRFSVISVTSTNGKTFVPNDRIVDNTKSSWTDSFNFFGKNKIRKIPMRRINDDKRTASERETIMTNFHTFLELNGSTVTIEPFKHPHGAKFMHWMLVSVFRVSRSKRKKEEDNEDEAPTRVFRDFTDHSNPSSPRATSPFIDSNTPSTSFASPNTFTSDPKLKAGSSTRKFATINAGESLLQSRRAISPDLIRVRDDNSDDSVRHFPLRKVSTINVGSLYRKKYNSKLRLSFGKGASVENLQQSSSSTSSALAGSFGLTKMLNRGRSMSINLGKSPQFPKPVVVPTPPASPHFPIMSNTSDMTKNVSTASTSQVEPKQNIEKDDIRPPTVVEKSSSIHSSESIVSPFPAELSPRPIVKSVMNINNKPSSNLKQGSVSSSKVKRSVPNPISHIYQRLSIFGEDVTSDESRSEEGRNTPSDVETDILLENLNRSKMFEERPKSMDTESTRFDDYENFMSTSSVLQAPGDQDGLSQGFTTIDFISNWQDHDSDDTARIMVYSEVWDIDEQFRAQVELAEAMEHI